MNKKILSISFLIISLIGLTVFLTTKKIYKNINVKNELKKELKYEKFKKEKLEMENISFRNEINSIPTSSEFTMILEIFLDINENPLLKFDINSETEIGKELSSSYKFKNEKLDSDDSDDDILKIPIKNSDKSDSVVLLKYKNKLNIKKIKNYLINHPYFLKKLLKKRQKKYEEYLNFEKRIEFSSELFLNLIYEKKIKFKMFKNLFLKIINNSKELNKELLKKISYKKKENENVLDEPINKLDLERFWLLLKKQKNSWLEWTNKNKEKIFYPKYYEIYMAGNFIFKSALQNKSIISWLNNKNNNIFFQESTNYLENEIYNEEFFNDSLIEGWGFNYKNRFNNQIIEKISFLIQKINEFLLFLDNFFNNEINLNSIKTLNIYEKELFSIIKSNENYFNEQIENIKSKINENPFLNSIYKNFLNKNINILDNLKEQIVKENPLEIVKKTKISTYIRKNNFQFFNNIFNSMFLFDSNNLLPSIKPNTNFWFEIIISGLTLPLFIIV